MREQYTLDQVTSTPGFEHLIQEAAKNSPNEGIQMLTKLRNSIIMHRGEKCRQLHSQLIQGFCPMQNGRLHEWIMRILRSLDCLSQPRVQIVEAQVKALSDQE